METIKNAGQKEVERVFKIILKMCMFGLWRKKSRDMETVRGDGGGRARPTKKGEATEHLEKTTGEEHEDKGHRIGINKSLVLFATNYLAQGKKDDDDDDYDSDDDHDDHDDEEEEEED
ncbi:hypothetical protein PoB_005367300 [Plakobranchus ocellatus]|uniref:Uncharacterized protein n=1 Tax=Plakobranchus ocellatus TaxID=259542 RepID=A0AAV4C6Q9_9GAST|nr:hypothetical protein PoB_005367300 [Plakobranchus ocellatus]